MSDGSTIEWLDRPGTKPASWNPIRAKTWNIQDDGSGKEAVGWYCEHVHEGCRHCYAESINLRLGTQRAYKPGELFREDRVGYNNGDIKPFLDEKTLLQPLKWKSPRTIFVCSMTDLYGSWVKDEWLDKIKAVQALTPQHTYIELTKRPEWMRDYNVARSMRGAETDRLAICMIGLLEHTQTPSLPVAVTDHNQNWPLPLKNVWGLVSCSTQEDADKFIPILLNTPLAIRGVSAEPLLGPIDFDAVPVTVAPGFFGSALRWHHRGKCHLDEGIAYPTLDWIIIGGESGGNARPMHPDWARSIKAQCEAAGVPMFFKQWGEWLGADVNRGQFDPTPMHAYRRADNHSYVWPHIQASHSFDNKDPWSGNKAAKRIGKKAAGRLLDGAEHNGFPQARTT